MILRDVIASDGDYSGRRLDSFDAIGGSFTRCDFSGVNAQSVCFAAGPAVTTYRDCVFDGCTFCDVIGGPARFERCSFEDVDIALLRCEATEFIDCTFSGRLRRGYFSGAPTRSWQHRLGRARNEFRGNDFGRAELVDISFRAGVDLSQQRLPTDPQKYLYCAAPQVPLLALRQEFLACGDLQHRRQALAALATLAAEIAHGQQQLFICKHSMTMFDATVLERIYAALGNDQ